MKMPVRTAVLFVALLAGLFAPILMVGCAKPQPVDNPFLIDQREYDRLYAATIRTLRDYGFQIDRQDYRFGTITTEPLTAPSLFEPWDPTDSTLKQTLDATLDHQRRIVTVRLQPEAGSEDADAYALDVDVTLERRNVATRRLNGTARDNVFVDLDDAPAELARRGIPRAYWQPIGRDAELEQRLLRDIVQRSFEMPG